MKKERCKEINQQMTKQTNKQTNKVIKTCDGKVINDGRNKRMNE